MILALFVIGITVALGAIVALWLYAMNDDIENP